MASGALLSGVALLASLAGGRAAAAESAVADAAARPAPVQPARFLALGDSYTIGEGVGRDERWPERLIELLADEGVAVGPPQVIARTGWTTARLADALTAAAPVGPYDLVTLMIGVNDQFGGRDVGDYERGFLGLLERAVALAGGDAGRVLVLSIPDYGVTPFARGLDLDAREVQAEIDAFNAVARRASERAGARWVDVTPASRAAATEAGLLAGDGLHPSGRLHAEWAKLVLAPARAALGARAALQR